jgi:hypothetical protein
MTGDRRCEWSFVDCWVVRHRHVVGTQRWLFGRGECGDDARVDAAGAHGADRHVAEQPEPDRLAKPVLELFGRPVAGQVGQFACICRVDEICRCEPRLIAAAHVGEVDGEDAPGQHAADALDRCMWPVGPAGDCLQQHIDARPPGDAGFEQDSKLAGEGEAAGNGRDVERFDAEAVAHQVQPSLMHIQGGEGEQPVAFAYALDATLVQQLQQRFGVAGASVRRVNESGADLTVVEDLAVVAHPPRTAALHHRLVAGVAAVEDRQAGMCKPDLADDGDAVVIRTAMRQQTRHALQRRLVRRSVRVRDETGHSAHGVSMSGGTQWL